MRAKKFDPHLIAETLQGTCDTLSGVIEQEYPDMTEDDLTQADHNALDNEVFLCDICGWWCEISESCNETENCGGSNCTDCCELEHEETD